MAGGFPPNLLAGVLKHMMSSPVNWSLAAEDRPTQHRCLLPLAEQHASTSRHTTVNCCSRLIDNEPPNRIIYYRQAERRLVYIPRSPNTRY